MRSAVVVVVVVAAQPVGGVGCWQIVVVVGLAAVVAANLVEAAKAAMGEIVEEALVVGAVCLQARAKDCWKAKTREWVRSGGHYQKLLRQEDWE